MENVGCVTFTERYIYREPSTESRRCGRAGNLHFWRENFSSEFVEIISQKKNV